MTERVTLYLRQQHLARDINGCAFWQISETEQTWEPNQLALLLCDVWDRHWSRGAMLRLEAMIPRMATVVQVARERGVHIIHAPSETMDFYRDHPARQRAFSYPLVEPPQPIERPDPPLPIDASDEGSDTQGDVPDRVWTRQHPGIPIDAERDLITDDGRQVYAYLCAEGIAKLLIMGVHTNMCILNRSFAIKQMVRWGVDVALVRDLTDAMYNPARPPYVDHAEGTRLVIGYIEKFWCPTFASDDLLR